MRCRPGDLAVFVRSVNPENIGRIVTVVRLANGAERPWQHEPGPAWIVTSPTPLIALCADGTRRPARTGATYDHCLHPICGDRPPLETTTQEQLLDHA